MTTRETEILRSITQELYPNIIVPEKLATFLAELEAKIHNTNFPLD